MRSLAWRSSVVLGLLLAAAGCADHVSRTELLERIRAGDAPVIVDVRSQGEYREAHVPGALHVPFYSVAGRADELPASGDEPVVVYCEHGPRAGLARAGLWLAGVGPVVYLEGHMSMWKEEGLPVEGETSEATPGMRNR